MEPAGCQGRRCARHRRVSDFNSQLALAPKKTRSRRSAGTEPRSIRTARPARSALACSVRRPIRPIMRKLSNGFPRPVESGNATAQCCLGVLYLRGKGIVQDDSRAAELFAAAAEQNHPEAMFYLGELYKTGRGVAQSLSLAETWLRRAATPRLCPCLSVDGTASRNRPKNPRL